MPQFSHGSLANVLLDGFDASEYLNELGVSGEIDTAETSAFGTTAKTYVPGLEDASVKLSGMWDRNDVDDTLSLSYKINSLRRVKTQATLLPRGDALLAPCYMVHGILTSAEIGTSVDDIASLDLEFQSCSGLDRGQVLHTLKSETATGESASPVDNTAATDNGAHAVLHVTSVSGTASPTLDVVVEHSADNTTFVPLITFGQKTAKGSEYAAVAGTINQYLKVTWTIAGTDPDFKFHLAVGRQ